MQEVRAPAQLIKDKSSRRWTGASPADLDLDLDLYSAADSVQTDQQNERGVLTAGC